MATLTAQANVFRIQLLRLRDERSGREALCHRMRLHLLWFVVSGVALAWLANSAGTIPAFQSLVEAGKVNTIVFADTPFMMTTPVTQNSC
jgi:hypothetical protein